MGRICRPMKMKAKMLRAKITVAHTALVGMRMRAGMRAGASARQRHGEADGGQHARQADVLRHQPHGEGAHELQDDGRRDVLHALEQRCISQPSAGPATRLPSTASRKAGATACTEKPPAATAPTARPVDQQRAGVVEQALAFEDGPGCAAAGAAGAAPRSRPRHRAARRWRPARWPPPRACPAPARGRPRRRPPSSGRPRPPPG
jgi:hypothetical protein